MRRSAFAFVLLLAACSSVEGATAPSAAPFSGAPQASAPAAANYPIAVDLPAGTYRLDPRHASAIFRIRHIGLSWFTARFDNVQASLELDPADPSRSRLTAQIDPISTNTNVLSAQGERSFDRQIGRALGEQPVTFVSTSIERTGQYTANVTGDLTMNGQTHPATLQVTFAGGTVDALRGAQMVLGFSAHGTINRADWDVTDWGQFAGDEVQIVIEAEFVRQ